jgi:hypothetical protein
MEDNLKKNKKNGRRPKKNKIMEDDLKKIKNLFSIPYKFRGKLSWNWLSSLRFF